MRKVFLTGGARGIGKAIAQKFLENGYGVVAPSRSELDLANDTSIDNYIESHKEEYFDVIVNNAGCNEIHEICDIRDDELEQMFRVNLISPIKLLRGLCSQMKKNGYGRIVNIGSVWAIVSKPGRCIYSATKHGLHGVTNTLAVELAPYHILVNTVCPGFVLTELTRKNNTPEEIQKISQDIPLGRMADPEEIAEIVYFLCSDKNTYLTGQKIAVDGGYTGK